jgi:hypothetical protein
MYNVCTLVVKPPVDADKAPDYISRAFRSPVSAQFTNREPKKANLYYPIAIYTNGNGHAFTTHSGDNVHEYRSEFRV